MEGASSINDDNVYPAIRLTKTREKANSIKVNVIVTVAVADTIVKFSPNCCYL